MSSPEDPTAPTPPAPPPQGAPPSPEGTVAGASTPDEPAAPVEPAPVEPAPVEPAPTEPAPLEPTGARVPLALPLVGLLIGVWAIIPPYIGPHLNTRARAEVADHIVPGVIVLAVALAALLVGRRLPKPEVPMLFAGGIVFLAGFWMVATHWPLVSDARRHLVPTGALVWHSVPSLALALFGLVWTARYWSEA